MSNDNKPRNEFLFFQNEILGDMKKLETKFSEKISQTTSFIETQVEKYENRIKDLSNRFMFIAEQVEQHNETKKLEDLIQKTKLKLEESITKIDVKLNILDKDFNNACFKYDKIVSNNLIVPGLIGSSCPFDTLKPFIEYTNQKLSELIKAKDKQLIDSKKYKEKMETIISQNKTQFETAQNKMTEYCSHGFKQCDVICKDRMEIIEKRIESLRLENGQHAYDLKQKTDELKIEWDKLDEMGNELQRKYKAEWSKYNDIVDKLNLKVERYKDEFFLIKKRFTELSDFIKDVRFRKNLNEMNMNTTINNTNTNENITIREAATERREYKEMGDKIDFSKKHRNKKHTYDIQNENKENDNLDPYSNYNSKNNHEENNEKKEKSNSNNIVKSADIKEIKKIEQENNQNNQKNDLNNQIKKEIKHSKFYNENKLNDVDTNFNKRNINKKNNELIMNRSSEFNNNISSNIKNNTIESLPEKKQDSKTKLLNTKINNNFNQISNESNTYNNSKYNESNTNNTNIIHYNDNFNTNRININKKNKNVSKSCMVINNEQKNIRKNKSNEDKNNFVFMPENAKINDLFLGADFSRYKRKEPEINLSQAYLLIKKRDEEIKKMKRTFGRKSEPKYNLLTPINYNTRNYNNYKKLQFLPKKYNKEDLYYSSLKKDKLRNISFNQNINLNLTNQNNTEKNIFPKLFKDSQNQVNSYLIDNYRQFPDNLTNTIVDYNTININENSFENRSESMPHNGKYMKNNEKKLLYSSSDRNLLPVKLSPITTNYKEHFTFDNINGQKQNSKGGNSKSRDILNYVKPLLINKIKDE